MMKKKPQDQKCRHRRKSIIGKMPSICFTVKLHHCNANTMHNPHDCHGCNPRRGELVINGGFENAPEPFLGWRINAGVETINPRMGDIPHQGFNAARLGVPNTWGRLYQDVPGICPGLFYQLNFFMSAASPCGNASVNVQMEFLDHGKNLLDSPALEMLIPQNSLNNEAFTFFINATHDPAPPNTKFARICFTTNTDAYPDRFVHLDDVSLIAT
jgi:hypothetical protein